MLKSELIKPMTRAELSRAIKKELKWEFPTIKFSVTSRPVYGVCIEFVETKTVTNEIIKEIAGHFAITNTDIHVNGYLAYYCDTQEYKKQQRKEYEKRQVEIKKKAQERENLYNDNVKIQSLDYNNIKVVNIEDKNIFVTALEPSLNKNNWKIDNDVEIDEKSYLNKYKITDIIYMDETNYNYFCFNLLNDYDFLTEKGGTWSDDETGDVLYHCAVCVYCEGKEPIIIDPQGYSYARYCCRLTEDVNGDLQKEINAELNINNNLYLEVVNNISITDLYIYNKGTYEYLDKKIVNDDRFIYDDYTSNVVITGLTYKELLKDGGIKLQLEKLHYNDKLLAENIIKCETGMCKQLFTKSKLETVFKGIKFSERLLKELKRATEQNPTPEPPKPTKREDNINNIETEQKQSKNNIVTIDFTQKQQVIVGNKANKDKWKQEPATTKQLYALHCITKLKTTGLKITKGKASELITAVKKGKELQEQQEKKLKENQEQEYKNWLESQIRVYNNMDKFNLAKKIFLHEIGQYSDHNLKKLLVLIENIDNLFSKEKLISWLHSGNKASKKVFYHITGIKLPSTDKATRLLLEQITLNDYTGMIEYKPRKKAEQKELKTFYKSITIPEPHFEESLGEEVIKYGLTMFLTKTNNNYYLTEAKSGCNIVSAKTKEELFKNLKGCIDRNGVNKLQELIKQQIEATGLSPLYKQEMTI